MCWTLEPRSTFMIILTRGPQVSKPRVKVRILKKKKSTLKLHTGRASVERVTKRASTTWAARGVAPASSARQVGRDDTGRRRFAWRT